jgi:hypothetical protein
VWYYPSSQIYPFEAYLKEKWGASLLTIIKMKKEEIGWWESLTKLVKLTKNDENSPNFSPNLGWLPQRRPREVSPTLPTFRQDSPNYDSFNWNLILLSFPPLMARKFHIASGNALDAWDSHAISVGSWFVVMQEALGTPFMDLLNHMHNRLIAVAHQTCKFTVLLKHYIMWYQNITHWILDLF